MTKSIGTDAVIAKIRLQQQSGDPGAAASGYWYLYIKSSGLYLENAAGVVTGPFITTSVKLDDVSTPDDNTDLDATTGHHGLLPKLGGGSTNFLRADGTWAAPTASGGAGVLEVQVFS